MNFKTIDPVIKTERLVKKYDSITVVDNLDLEVAEGEIFGFLGPNGAGKTTTVRVLTTLTKPTSGSAFVSGFDVVDEPVRAKGGMAAVPQYLNVDVELTAYENLKLHGMLHKMKKREMDEQIERMLDFVELADRKGSLVKTFSGGMKRRLMIARALLHGPKVLFLDEPTVGLDPQTRRKIWDMIRKINRNGGTIFLTTHYIEEAEALCHRVGIIDHGKLIALDSPAELLKRTGSVVVEMFTENGTETMFFENRRDAADFAASLDRNVIIRNSNLEDVFVKLTGRRVTQ